MMTSTRKPSSSLKFVYNLYLPTYYILGTSSESKGKFLPKGRVDTLYTLGLSGEKGAETGGGISDRVEISVRGEEYSV